MLVRNTARICATSIMPHATMNKSAPITASGKWLDSGATTSSNTISINAEPTAANGVRAPASWLAPLRLNEPLLA